ncbi:hypothetical protein MSG28_002239 [Choristoneura fumiferana]|uniref:Uncharacterized protein n=1 Tax=Choristoneura fumiferana TaxID=7141 RepID=A0ACC0JUW6_CHOFU|nr:hypothetical protein MSG28_002239 [Choristoneura fumiferana]
MVLNNGIRDTVSGAAELAEQLGPVQTLTHSQNPPPQRFWSLNFHVFGVEEYRTYELRDTADIRGCLQLKIAEITSHYDYDDETHIELQRSSLVGAGHVVGVLARHSKDLESANDTSNINYSTLRRYIPTSMVLSSCSYTNITRRERPPGSCRSVNAKVTRSGEVTPSARQPARRGQCAAGARHDHTPVTPTRHASPPPSHVRLLALYHYNVKRREHSAVNNEVRRLKREAFMRSARGNHGFKMKLFKRRLSFSGDKQKQVSRSDDPFENERERGALRALQSKLRGKVILSETRGNGGRAEDPPS